MAVGEAARKFWWEEGHLAYLLWEIQGDQPVTSLDEFIHLLATEKERSLGQGLVVSGAKVMGSEGGMEDLARTPKGNSWRSLSGKQQRDHLGVSWNDTQGTMGHPGVKAGREGALGSCQLLRFWNHEVPR